MIHYGALGIQTAHTRARVFAFLVFTSQMIGTFGVIGTFRAAIGRSAYKILQTRTRGLIAHYPTLRIWSAGCRNARVFWCFWWWGY